jgi:cardiolipin synthase
LLVPVFIGLLLEKNLEAALWVFAIGMLTDWVDGLLARTLNQKTSFGAVLDPIADKLMIFSALLWLTLVKALPWWLVGLLVVRDGWMAMGAFRVRRRGETLPEEPSRFGKYSTFALTTIAVLAFFQMKSPSSTLQGYIEALALISGLFIIVSTVQYVFRFGHLWNTSRRT